MKLTEHFTLYEMSRSETAIRKGLDNTIPEELVPNAKKVAEVLETIRFNFNSTIRVLSCYRSPQVNKAVGGSPTSAHRFAMAADFEVEGVPNIEVCKWIAKYIPNYDQVIYEFGPSGWVHLGLTDGKPRKQQLTAIKRDSKTVYLQGIV